MCLWGFFYVLKFRLDKLGQVLVLHRTGSSIGPSTWKCLCFSIGVILMIISANFLWSCFLKFLWISFLILYFAPTSTIFVFFLEEFWNLPNNLFVYGFFYRLTYFFLWRNNSEILSHLFHECSFFSFLSEIIKCNFFKVIFSLNSLFSLISLPLFLALFWSLLETYPGFQETLDFRSYWVSRSWLEAGNGLASAKPQFKVIWQEPVHFTGDPPYKLSFILGNGNWETEVETEGEELGVSNQV